MKATRSPPPAVRSSDAARRGVRAVHLRQRDRQENVEEEGIHINSLISDIAPTRITKGLLERLLQRLVIARVLTQRHTAVLRMRRWPTADREPEDEIRRRLQSCLVGEEEPAERTAALISLLLASGALTTIVRPRDVVGRKAIQTRAASLSDGDWAGAAVQTALAERANGMG